MTTDPKEPDSQAHKRVKLAEYEGWKCAPHVADFDKHVAVMCWYKPGNGEWQTEQLPDYFGDLNVVCQSVSRLPVWSPGQQLSGTQQAFTHELELVCSKPDRPASHVEVTNASAEQRAEALGIALGLWRRPAPMV